jgi:molybdopterin/thiamine biosynthesis adenylyltransferase
VRPRLKPFERRRAEGSIVLWRELGVEYVLSDASGQVDALLDLLDGTRTLAEVRDALAARWPELGAGDVADGLGLLDEAGLLENADAPTTLDGDARARYFSNLAFFSSFATLRVSRFSFQERLSRSHVLLLGVGGVGSTLLMNLAGLGVGRITAVDYDRVELKNFSRQFVYAETDIGSPKLERALARVRAFNSSLRIDGVERRIGAPEDVASLLPGVDLVLAVIDQPREVQDWVNEACVTAGVPYVAGGVMWARGTYYSVDPRRSACRGCWPIDAADVRAPGERLNRATGPAATLISSLIALEALRYLTRFAPPVAAGSVWLADFETGAVERSWSGDRAADCAVCSERAAAVA